MSLPPPIIGLTGRAGAGKDTAYGYIEEWAKDYGLVAKREAFADRLKVSAAAALGYIATREQAIDFCNALKLPGSGITVTIDGGADGAQITGRQFLQLYGTEAHRDVFGADFWIDAALPSKAATGLQADDHDILVVTDVRFPNEAEAIRNRHGQVWRIARPVDGPQDTHASETPLPEELIDRTIWNVNDKDQLRYNLRYTLTGIAKRVEVNL